MILPYFHNDDSYTDRAAPLYRISPQKLTKGTVFDNSPYFKYLQNIRPHMQDCHVVRWWYHGSVMILAIVSFRLNPTHKDICEYDFFFPFMIIFRTADECQLYNNPCFNGGNCTEKVDGFQCQCPHGFSGTYCEKKDVSSACSNIDCSPGMCVLDPVTNMPFCSCAEGLGGRGNGATA